MENGDEKITDYSFLLDSHVEENFAELNWSLLSGRHISPEDSLHFGILEDHQEFIAYYKNLYQLSLERIEFDGVPCYYLGFFDSGKGKLNERSRIKPLSEIQTVIGLIFLDMYYARYFDHPKLVNWQ